MYLFAAQNNIYNLDSSRLIDQKVLYRATHLNNSSKNIIPHGNMSIFTSSAYQIICAIFIKNVHLQYIDINCM
jgi:hypothetical protein